VSLSVVKQPISQSISLSVYPSAWRSVCQSVNQAVCLSVCQSISLSVVSHSACPFIFLSVDQSVCWSVDQSVNESRQSGWSVSQSVSQSVIQSVNLHIVSWHTDSIKNSWKMIKLEFKFIIIRQATLCHCDSTKNFSTWSKILEASSPLSKALLEWPFLSIHFWYPGLEVLTCS